MIPALKNAEYARYGVMHRNTFINSTETLNPDYSMKEHPKTYFAGQITGVEGYVESAASGLCCAIYLAEKLRGNNVLPVSENTVMGALAKYITTPNKDFQPMNANFGILNCNTLIRDKAERKKSAAEKSLAEIKKFKEQLL